MDPNIVRPLAAPGPSWSCDHDRASRLAPLGDSPLGYLTFLARSSSCRIIGVKMSCIASAIFPPGTRWCSAAT